MERKSNQQQRTKSYMSISATKGRNNSQPEKTECKIGNERRQISDVHKASTFVERLQQHLHIENPDTQTSRVARNIPERKTNKHNPAIRD